MTTNNDRKILADFANSSFKEIFQINPDFSIDGWDKSGATAAVAETFGYSVSKLAGSWGNVVAYKERQYQWAEKTIANAETKISQLSNSSSVEATALRRAAESTAQSMKNMGDLAAGQVPGIQASSAANAARTASVIANIASSAGSIIALGQMASVTYDAAKGEQTVHEVMGTAAGSVAGLGAAAYFGALGATAAGTALLPSIAAAVAVMVGAFVVGKLSQAAYDKWGKGLTDFLGDTGRWWGNEIYDWLHPDSARLIADLQSKFQQAGVTVSPLILDLDGDGVETIGKSAGIHFDHDGNHFAETTGWAGKDDGLLVWDRNGNTKIDDGSELFGDQTKLADGCSAANGFAALAELDSNYDGVVDALDANFTHLRVWKDADSNATVSDGELLGLDEAGVQSIKVAYIQQSITDTQGNQHLQVGQYTRVDGSTRAMDDVWFAADMASTTDMHTVAIADDIAALSDLQGLGNVQSLHQAMARDTTGKLSALVGQFAQTLDSDERKALFDDILYTWTGSDLYAANARGSYFGDARKLYALEAFLGQTFVQGSGTNAGTNDPGPNAAQVLSEAYGSLSGRFYGQLMAQTHFKDLYDSVGLTLDVDTFAISLDVSKTLDKISAQYDANPEQAWSFTNEFATGLKAAGDFGAQTIAALKTHSSLNGTGFSLFLALAVSDFMLGDSGANEMTANPGQDTNFMGMDGNDRLIGNGGNNILIGGTGADLLSGSTGNDTYVFARGDGVDIINDYDTMSGNTDVAQFTNVASTQVTSLERKGNNLVLKYAEADQLTVQGYFDPNYLGCRIERFSFRDGVSWDDAAIKARVITNGSTWNDYLFGYDDGANRIDGLDGNDYLWGGEKDDIIDGGADDDTLYGYGGDDRLIGGDGNDTINGGDGNDVIDGGTGSDLLYGGDGADVIRFGRGYGADNFGSSNTAAFRLDTVDLFDINAEDVSLFRTDDVLKVLVKGSNDSLTVGYYFASGSATTVDTMRFADGTVLDDAAVKARVITNGSTWNDYINGYDDGANRIYGLDGDDYLSGGTKDDFIDGGAGNDTLYGYAGNDIFQGASGMDALADTDGNNLFHGGADNDVLNGGSGNEVYLGGAGNDAITTGLGYDLIAFNRGDGQDTVAASSGRDNTLSLGGGIAYADLSLSRSANNLVLTTGVNESLTFKDWYASPDKHSVANLQMVVEGSNDYDAASSDGLLNQKIAQFDFDAMVSRFDAAQAASPGLSNWALSSAMLDFHLASSDTAAIGGDLAYQYGRYGDLSGMSVNAAQALLAGAQFGAARQALQGGATLHDLSPRLM